MYVLVFQRKPYLHLVNGFNSFKLVQNFDAHNSNQKKKKNLSILELFGTCATLQTILEINKCIFFHY